MTQFHNGTAEQAKENNWISMKAGRQKFETQLDFHNYMLKLTCFNSQQLKDIYDTPKLWAQFQKKISTFFPIIYNLTLAKAYFKHICLKFIKNGYDRIQFRIGFMEIHQYIKKVYHAGQTKKIDNNNIEIAINSGTVRIGHGCNILKKKVLRNLLQKNICFENCPASNVVIGYVNDSRFTIVPTLLNLGIPVSINPDDPGKFNCLDATFDFHMSVVSYDWSLKQLKLVIIHSINGAICSEEEKDKLAQNFHKKWDEWVQTNFSV